MQVDRPNLLPRVSSELEVCPVGMVEDLVQARAEYETGDWSGALDVWSGVDPADISTDDLHDAASAAYLLGRRAASVHYEGRAFAGRQEAGDTAGAVRSCFHLALVFGTNGDAALAQGWTARVDRLVDELDQEAVERGYVSVLHMYAHLAAVDLPAASAAAERATTVAREHHDQDLLALGLCGQGRLALYSGRIADGLRLLDEAMVGVAADEVTPIVFGDVYCTAIEGCQAIGEFGRVGEWTSALHSWCLAHPGLVAFSGQCSVHRGQLLQVRGAWPEALEEFASAIERYRLADSVAAVGVPEIASATGAVEFAAGDAVGAPSSLRKAHQLWAHAQRPYEGARVRLLRARALIAVGDQESARRELEAACATFRELAAAPAAETAERLLRPAGHPAGLTDREVEVLRLVASGRSNMQIAGRLVLSEKTVARHLSNIFTKLDVGSRTAAAAYAYQHHLV